MLKWSNFHITINLNQCVEESTKRGLVRNFASAIDTAINDFPFKWIVRYEGGQRPFHDHEKLLVETIRARVGFERDLNGTNRSLHAHIVLEIGHRTIVQINMNALKRIIDKELGIVSNIHVRFLDGKTASATVPYILRYITKTVQKPLTHGVSSADRRLRDAMGPGSQGQHQPIDNENPF